MKLLRLIRVAFLSSMLLSSYRAPCQERSDPLDIPTGFNLGFTVLKEDLRSKAVREMMASDREASGPTARNREAAAMLRRPEPPVHYRVDVLATSGGIRYARTGDGREITVAFDEVKDESYACYSSNKEHSIWIYPGFQWRELSPFPVPGVGLYRVRLFTPQGVTADKVDGTGYIHDVRELAVPATSRFARIAGRTVCVDCLMYFDGPAKLPRVRWTFSEFVNYAGRMIARKSVCTEYQAWGSRSKPGPYATDSAPARRTTYQLVSRLPVPGAVDYSVQGLVNNIKPSSTGIYPMVEYFRRDGRGIVSFNYSPGDGPLEIQKRRALALLKATPAQDVAQLGRSGAAGWALLAVIACAVAWGAIRRRKARSEVHSGST